MNVGDLIVALQGRDPLAEVHIPCDDAFFDTSEVHRIYESTAQYGILTPNPTTVKTVVLARGCEGL